MRRAALFAGMLALMLAACRASRAPDGGLDAGPTDGSMDARMDAPVDASTDAADASFLDAAWECASDEDCAGNPVNVRCDRFNACAPAFCYVIDTDPCAEPFSCVRRLCLPRACSACAMDTVCDPVDGSCVAPESPTACRASGGMYVRGRCMRPGAPDPICGTGYASETLPAVDDVPVVPGAELGRLGVVRVGPFPVARLSAPVPATLTAEYLPTGSWRFDYIDPTLPGAGAVAELILSPEGLGEYRSGGCIRPGVPGFEPASLCERAPAASAFACGGLDLMSRARSGEQTGLAGRDVDGHVHLELWKSPRFFATALVASHDTPAASQVWPPLLFGSGETLVARIGLAPPLSLIQIGSSSPLIVTDAGLGIGAGLTQWSGGGFAARRERDGALVYYADGLREAPTLLSSVAPPGRYRTAWGRSAGPLLLAQIESSELATLHVLGDGALPPSGSPSAMELLTVADLGPAVAVASVGRVAWIFAAMRRPEGDFELVRILPSSGGEPTVDRLIASEDVGGEIVAVTDLANSGGLVGAMLEIRQADASIVHELWGVALKWW